MLSWTLYQLGSSELWTLNYREGIEHFNHYDEWKKQLRSVDVGSEGRPPHLKERTRRPRPTSVEEPCCRRTAWGKHPDGDVGALAHGADACWGSGAAGPRGFRGKWHWPRRQPQAAALSSTGMKPLPVVWQWTSKFLLQMAPNFEPAGKGPSLLPHSKVRRGLVATCPNPPQMPVSHQEQRFPRARACLSEHVWVLL